MTNRLIGFLAALQLLLLPVTALEARSLEHRQAYLSARRLHKTSNDSDMHLQHPVCVVNFRSNIHLVSSTAFLPTFLPTVLKPSLARQYVVCVYQTRHSLAFLRLLFEHQIAINAP